MPDSAHRASQRRIACPRCGAATDYSPGNAWRPFCSERCKLIDLGDWAAERYRVPQALPPADADEENPS
jgi:hypothetical protein